MEAQAGGPLGESKYHKRPRGSIFLDLMRPRRTSTRRGMLMTMMPPPLLPVAAGCCGLLLVAALLFLAGGSPLSAPAAPSRRAAPMMLPRDSPLASSGGSAAAQAHAQAKHGEAGAHADEAESAAAARVVGDAEARARGAVIGAFVADAATMGLHWIYSTGEIDRKVGGDSSRAAFFTPPSSPFYQYASGASSPYGDELQPLLRTLAAHGGRLDPEAFAQESARYFSEYQGRLNSVMRSFTQRVLSRHLAYPHTGVDDDQAHALVKVPLLVLAFGGAEAAVLRRKVEEAVRVHQDNGVAVALAQALALLLQQVTHRGRTVQQALEWGLSSGELPAQAVALLKDAQRSLDITTRSAAARHGSSCHLPGSFVVPVHAMLTHTDYATAVIDNILAGGDQASRAIVIGAFFAAQDPSSVPRAWLDKTSALPEITTLLDAF